jgi:hypothetical protein
MIAIHHFTRAGLLLLALCAVLAAAHPAEAQKKKKNRFPDVRGTWLGQLAYDDERPNSDARLYISWQNGRKWRGALTAAGYTNVPVNGTVKKNGVVVVKMRQGRNRGRIKGRLNPERTAVAGRWMVKQPGKVTRGDFLMERQQR